MTTINNEKKGKWRDSITFKLIVIIMLSLLLLIPSLMVKKLIDERNYRRKDAISEVTDKWAEQQTISGPVLIVPIEKTKSYYNGSSQIERQYLHFLPEKTSINGNIIVENRKRGIYKIPLYSTNLKIEGYFSPITFDKSENPEIKKILWEEACLSIGISDLKGISTKPKLKWAGSTEYFQAGSFFNVISPSGIHIPVKVNFEENSEFSLTIDLKGSDAIYFTPTANEFNVQITSNWNNPSFDGDFLPVKSNLENIKESNGFEAKWNINEMSRKLPQNFTNSEYNQYDNYQNFGVKFLQTVDAYQKSTRAIKYNFLFIILTFLIIFFSEIVCKTKIHAFQYLIIGIALVIFYSLLIALAEHTSFNLAYLISGVTIVLMNTGYIHSLLKNRKTTITVFVSLSVLYIFLFTILQISDYALLLGNIGLVLILGIIMIFSKKINWYGEQEISENNRINQ